VTVVFVQVGKIQHRRQAKNTDNIQTEQSFNTKHSKTKLAWFSRHLKTYTIM